MHDHQATITALQNQRNAALDHCANLQGLVAGTDATRAKAYELLAQCIDSGQVPAERAIQIMQDAPHFGAWYKGRK